MSLSPNQILELTHSILQTIAKGWISCLRIDGSRNLFVNSDIAPNHMSISLITFHCYQLVVNFSCTSDLRCFIKWRCIVIFCFINQKMHPSVYNSTSTLIDIQSRSSLVSNSHHQGEKVTDIHLRLPAVSSLYVNNQARIWKFMTFSSLCDQLKELDSKWSILHDRSSPRGHCRRQPVIIFSGH